MNYTKNSLFLLTVLGSFILLNVKAIEYSNHLSCNGDYRLPDAVPEGTAHMDIERAGVALLKDYGTDDQTPNDRYAIILGNDKNLSCYLPQSGKKEKADQYSSQTAARELKEETGGLLKYSSADIAKLPYIYAGRKQLFFLLNPIDQNISVSKIDASCRKAQTNKKLNGSYKEIDGAIAVSIVDLMDLAQKIDNGSIQQSKTYTLKTRSKRKQIQIEGSYMQMFGHPRDHSRYDNAKKIFNACFKTNIF